MKEGEREEKQKEDRLRVPTAGQTPFTLANRIPSWSTSSQGSHPSVNTVSLKGCSCLDKAHHGEPLLLASEGLGHGSGIQNGGRDLGGIIHAGAS